MNSRCKIWGDGTIMIGRAHVRCFYPPCAGEHQASVLANSVLAGEVGGGELGWGGGGGVKSQIGALGAAVECKVVVL